MRLTSLQLENFGPYEKETIDFTKFKTNKVLILGENHDEEGLDSNGSGKSMLFEAVCWAIAGQTSKRRKVKSEDVIGPFGDSTKITLKMSGRFDLEIIRERGAKHKLEFKVNGVEKHVRGDVEKSQNNLLMYFGVSKDFHQNWFEDFMNLTYFSNEVAQIFTGSASKPSDRFDFISRYLSLRILDLCKENAKSKLNKVDGDLSSLRSQVSLIENRLKSLDSQESLEEEIKKCSSLIESKNQELSSYSKELDKIQKATELKGEVNNKKVLIDNKKQDLDKKLNELKNLYDKKVNDYEKLDEVKKELDQLKENEKIDITELYDKIEKQEKAFEELSEPINSLEVKITLTKNEIKQKEIILEKNQKCPKCGTNLMPSEDGLVVLNKTILESEIKNNKEHLNKLNIEIDILKTKKSEAADLISVDKNLINQYQIQKNKIIALETKLENKDNLQEEINSIIEQKESWEKTTKEYIISLEKELSNLQRDLTSLGDVLTLPQYNEITSKINEEIKNLNSSINRFKFSLEKIEEEKNEYDKLKKEEKILEEKQKQLKFAVEGFPIVKKWRIDDFIPSFRLEINSHLMKLGSSLKVLIDTEAETKKGTIKDSFPIEARDAYGKIRGLETFSEGEKSRISLAIAWALKTLIENQNYLPFDFTMMDEIADGLDETGIQMLSNLIDNTEKQFYVISHFNVFKDVFSETINVVKEKGKSIAKVKNL